MKITNLTYIDDEGNKALYGEKHDPYIGEMNDELGKKLWFSPSLNLSWKCEYDNGAFKDVILNSGGISMATKTLDSRFIVVVFPDSEEWPWPANAAIFNADGSLKGKIFPPQGVTSRPIEGIGGAKLEKAKIILWCYYNYDRLVYIEFDPETMKWGNVVHIGGRS